MNHINHPSAWAIPGIKINKSNASVIIDAACKVSGLDYTQLCETRKRDRVMVRYAAMNMLREQCNLSCITVGRMFNRDHSTVIHARYTHERMKYDFVYSEIYEKMTRQVNHLLNAQQANKN